MSRRRRMPLVQLLAYYIILVLAATVLVLYVPAVQRAFLSPIVLSTLTDPSDALSQASPPPPSMGEGTVQRSLTTALSALGIMAIVLPVAWVYMFTRGFRYDRALVQSVIILPLVIAGMVMIVKNSLALAFSLAGIVAAVRFRNTLQDPRDAVYIFLALGLGLSAGVQALDIALVMSLMFNLVVLSLWRFDIASVAGTGGTEDMLSIGDPSLRMARTRAARKDVCTRYADAAKELDADGILLLQGPELESARTAAEAALGDIAKEWKFADPTDTADGARVLPVLVRFKKKTSPVDLLGELDEYWTAQVTAAEYVPYSRDNE